MLRYLNNGCIDTESLNRWLANSKLFLTISGTETKMVIKYYDYDDIDVEQTM